MQLQYRSKLPGYIFMLIQPEVGAVQTQYKLDCGSMPKVMVALPNIGGALCSTPQSLADAHYYKCHEVTLPRRKTR